MTSEDIPPDRFDADQTAATLAGTWSYLAAEEPTGTAYMHLTADGRVFQFIFDSQRPEKRHSSRLSFNVESPVMLRLLPQGDPKGWTVHYQLDDEILTLSPPTSSFSCLRVAQEEVPEWLRTALAKLLS